MKIEKLGVKITAGSGTVYYEITVSPEDGIYVNGASWARAEAEEIRDALTAALAGYDALNAPPEPAPVTPHLAIGQVLSGSEDLPIGTVVRDKDGDPWDITADLPLNNIRKAWAPFTIERLP